MTAPSIGIKDLLVSHNIGTFKLNHNTPNSSPGWGISISRQHDKLDTLITIYDTQGLAPEPHLDINRPGVQILVRGSQSGYMAAYQKCEEIRDVLLGLPSQTINGDIWASLTMTSDILWLGYDENERPQFSLNFLLITHQGNLVNSNRESC
jgi:hypothetical protein